MATLYIFKYIIYYLSYFLTFRTPSFELQCETGYVEVKLTRKKRKRKINIQKKDCSSSFQVGSLQDNFISVYISAKFLLLDIFLVLHTSQVTSVVLISAELKPPISIKQHVQIIGENISAHETHSRNQLLLLRFLYMFQQLFIEPCCSLC